MAEKRYKSFVVIGDDDAKTTRVFYYIGSGENRSAENMRQDALDYFEEKFQGTFSPEISNQRNYNKNPQEFRDAVVEAQRNGDVEYAKVPKLGERWVITPKQEETPTESGEEAIVSSPVQHHEQTAEWYTPSMHAQNEDHVGIEDDDDGFLEDDDDDDDDEYEEEDETRIFNPFLGGVTTSRFSDRDDELTSEPGEVVIVGNDPGDENDRDTAELVIIEHPADVTTDDRVLDYITPETPHGEFERFQHDAPVQAIGGFHIPKDSEKDKQRPATPQTPRPDQQQKNDSGKLPTTEEMDAELKRLREIPIDPRQEDSAPVLREYRETHVAL